MRIHHRLGPYTLIALILLTILSHGLAPQNTPPAFAQVNTHLGRYPYLTDVVGQHATINWGTDHLANNWTGRATWGKAGGGCATNAVSATKSSISVKGVQAFQWQ